LAPFHLSYGEKRAVEEARFEDLGQFPQDGRWEGGFCSSSCFPFFYLIAVLSIIGIFLMADSSIWHLGDKVGVMISQTFGVR